MSRANADFMDLIHGLVASTLKDELVRAASAVDADGNPVPVNPQLIDKAMKFLKDNGIDAPKGTAKTDELAAELSNLPDVDLDEAAHRLN